VEEKANEWKNLYERKREGFYERNRWRVENIKKINREKGIIEKEILGRERERLKGNKN